MTDPSNQGGRPLDSTIQFPQSNDPSSTHHRRRRRDSQSSDERTDGTKSSPSRRRPSPRKDVSLGPHAGSSRRDSSTMQRSTSPTQMPSDMNSINYTRTGRISKAKKGLKVHNCECGRSYTRAEHLRRHQKNHDSETLVCDFPECGKPFHRPDLLQRHQERHSETGKDSRTPSYTGQGTSAEADTHVTAPVTLSSPSFTNLPHTQASYYASVVSPAPESTQDPSNSKRAQIRVRGPLPVTIPVQMEGASMSWHDPFNQSPTMHSSSSEYNSPLPTSDYANIFAHHPYGSGPNRTRTSSDASRIEPTWIYSSQSPASTTSTMAYQWPSSDKSTASGHLAYMNTDAYPMSSVPMVSGVDSVTGYGAFGPKSMVQRDEEEHMVLFPEQSFGMDHLADSYPYGQYLDNYWRLFHPHFPVVHRTIVDSVNDSPMLRAAMIAIGAQYSTDFTAKRKARLLHDRCMKMFTKRELDIVTEPERLCDYQALLLVEVMSQYRARRAATTLSNRFETLYQRLHQNLPEVITRLSNLTAGLLPHDFNFDLWRQWIDLAGEQRLLQGCYILESQQTIFLARTSQQSTINSSGLDLPMAVHSSLWDATNPADWALAAQQYTNVPSCIYQINSNLTMGPLDVFQSSLLIAAHYSHLGDSASYLSPPNAPIIEHLLDSSPATKHLLLTAQLVQITPIRSLLAVPGESWILSEKVSSAAAFAHSNHIFRSWVSGLWTSSAETPFQAAREALKLSIELLQHAIMMPGDNSRLALGADMGLYYATLVIWSVTVVAHTRINAARGQNLAVRYSTPSPLPYDARNPCALPSTPTHFSSTTSRSSQSPNPAHPLSSGLLQSTQMSPAIINTDSSMSYSDIEATARDFLSMASIELDLHGQGPQLPNDVVQWQQGCAALMRWVKMRFRIESVNIHATSGPISLHNGNGGDAFGELLDGIIVVLEKMISRGWDGWGF